MRRPSSPIWFRSKSSKNRDLLRFKPPTIRTQPAFPISLQASINSWRGGLVWRLSLSDLQHLSVSLLDFKLSVRSWLFFNALNNWTAPGSHSRWSARFKAVKLLPEARDRANISAPLAEIWGCVICSCPPYHFSMIYKQTCRWFSRIKWMIT